MKKLLIMLLAVCLMLSGCMSGSYFSVQPNQANHTSGDQQAVAVSTYFELQAALTEMVAKGAQKGTFIVGAMGQEQVERNMRQAEAYVTQKDPVGAYAVEEISYELGQTGAVPALAVKITYSRTREEILRIPQVTGMEQAVERIYDCLDSCGSGVVVLVDGYEELDFVQLVQDYADQYPDKVMEIPEIAAAAYPQSGKERVMELKFTYQNNRENLRKMQNQVESVFASAELYVSGDSSEKEKLGQLFSFLTQRFDYQFETSITAPYSLLCHGVGDSKAFAVSYAAMCRRAGLECLVVSGTRDAEAWFWNIVLDGDTYYHVDLLDSLEQGSFQERLDEEMQGYVWDYSAYPACVPAAPLEATEPVDAAATQPEVSQETTLEPEETDPPVQEQTTPPDAIAEE